MKTFENKKANIIARSGDNCDVCGEGNVIARRCFNTDVAISLIKESMDKESLLAAPSCFMRLPRLRLAMTVLALVFSLGVAGESWAACNTGDFSCNRSSGVTAYCCYHIVSQDSEGNNKNIEIYKDPAAPDDIEASVGSQAFWGNNTISSVSIGEGVTTIGMGAFYYATALENVSMPYVKTIEDLVFWGSPVSTLDMPSLQKVISRGLAGSYPYISFPADAEVCINGYGCIKTSNCRITKNEKGEDYKICGTCDDYVKSGTGCVKDCGTGYLGKEGKCIDSSLGCGERYRNMGGFCNRVRYTPAEAAAIAKDDGNVVTITFRK